MREDKPFSASFRSTQLVSSGAFSSNDSIIYYYAGSDSINPPVNASDGERIQAIEITFSKSFQAAANWLF